MNRDFHAANPNELWVTDITEFRIPAGKVYLSPVIDCYDGMPVAWTIGTSPNAALANGMPECIASMFVGRVRQCFSAVWADGFSPVSSSFPGDVIGIGAAACIFPSCDSNWIRPVAAGLCSGRKGSWRYRCPLCKISGDSTGRGCRVRR